MQIRRLFDFIYHQQEKYPLEKAIGHEYEGTWVYYSTDRVIDLAAKLGRGLIGLGLKPGDKVGIVAYKNRPEWVITDLALQQIGAISVPVYPTISSREYEYIFNEAEVRYCFCGIDDLVSKVREAQKHVSTLKEVYAFDQRDDAPHWSTLWTDEHAAEFKERRDSITPDTLATIIYTSGTTGNPKGVMLNHNNIVTNVLAVQEVMPLEPGDRVLSFLPLCHIFERAASFSYLYNGIEINFTGTDNLGGETGDLAKIQPHFFTTVPRLLEKVYEKIYNKGLGLKGIKRALFFWALSLTNDYEFDKSYSGWAGFKRKIADKLIFSKWRAALGGNIKGILTGAAPCPLKMARVFSAAGVPIREGYGLTESSPGIALGLYTPNGAMLGAVGPALSGIEIIIDESDGTYKPGEGEVVITGPNVMQGYYKKPEETAAVIFEADGKRWLRTGDIGKLLDGPGGRKYLTITDRKKELLKTSGGKYVAPAPIENKLKEDFLVEQVMVVGEQRKFVSAVIVPTEQTLKEWCERHEIAWTSRAEAIKHPEVIAKFQQIVDRFNPLFNKIEQIKKFTLIDADWEPSKADGTDAELTPTMKLKRRVIRQKFSSEIESLYAE